MVEDTNKISVQNKHIFREYGEELKKINTMESERENNFRQVELFFSFDIVNSSSYKDMNYYSWPQVLTALLRRVQKSVAKEIPEARLWRVIGDEVVFYVTIKGEEEIYQITDSIFYVLTSNVMEIKSGKFFDELEDQFRDNEILALKSQNILSLQAAAWIAIVSPKSEQFIGAYENIIEKYEINGKGKILEFLGQDIDAGFRIKSQTQERRMVVSFELACILAKRTEYLSKLFIITYKNLKGIWKNALYPIIWFYDENCNQNIKFEDSFYYDETNYNELSREYFGNRKYSFDIMAKDTLIEFDKCGVRLGAFMYVEVSRALDKILLDRKLSNKIEQILNVINETDKDTTSNAIEDINELVQLHCVAVCCDVEHKRIFIAKRTDKEICPGAWEFGCAKANVEENISDTLKREYKQDFSLDIEVISDIEREDREPRPIAIYQIKKQKRLEKGIITVAKILNNCDKFDLDNCLKEQKHEKAKWISEGDLEEFKEETVLDFKDTLKKVFENWNIYFGEEKSCGNSD